MFKYRPFRQISARYEMNNNNVCNVFNVIAIRMLSGIQSSIYVQFVNCDEKDGINRHHPKKLLVVANWTKNCNKLTSKQENSILGIPIEMYYFNH